MERHFRLAHCYKATNLSKVRGMAVLNHIIDFTSQRGKSLLEHHRNSIENPESPGLRNKADPSPTVTDMIKLSH